jgi:nucleoside-diphosphate-sugar epimerase
VTTIAITGAGGFIGLAMIRRAVARGLLVRGLDISEAAARRAADAGAEAIVGDVNDASAVRALVQGAQVVFHTAAIVEEDGRLEDFRRVNVEGTRTVAELARDAGVRRLLHLSSVMVYGFRYPDGVDEDGPLRGEGNAYCQTKIESERVALSFHDPAGMGVLVPRPGDVYGPGSVPWIVRPLALMRRRMFLLPASGGVINHVHVENLIDAAFLALDRDISGIALNVTDGTATPCREFFAHHARWLGRDGVPTLPDGLMRISLRAGAALFRLAGRKPPAVPAAVDFLSRKHAVSTERARRVLGYVPRIALAEGMAEIARTMNPEGR